MVSRRYFAWAAVALAAVCFSTGHQLLGLSWTALGGTLASDRIVAETFLLGCWLRIKLEARLPAEMKPVKLYWYLAARPCRCGTTHPVPIWGATAGRFWVDRWLLLDARSFKTFAAAVRRHNTWGRD